MIVSDSLAVLGAPGLGSLRLGIIRLRPGVAPDPGVQFTAHQDGQSGRVEPQQQNDHSSEGAIGLAV